MSATTTKSQEMETLLVSSARSRNTVIPDGVDRRRFFPQDRAEARADLGWPSDSPIVLVAGRTEAPEKRLWLAQEVIRRAGAEIPDIDLRIANGVPPSEMPARYAAVDCLLHTSVSEGSPNVIKEALACNLPVVATPAGDVRELLRGVNGCAVCEADPIALASALVDILRHHPRSNGRQHTERLSIDATAQRTIDCYRELGLSL